MEGYTDSELQSLVRMGEVSPCAWQVPQEGLLWPVPVQTPSWEREAKTQKPRGPTEAVKRGAVATCGPGFPDLSELFRIWASPWKIPEEREPAR